jgi:Cu/Zn superoxide dismutase
MRRSTTLAALVVAAVFALVGVACGGDDEEPAAETTAAETTAPEEAEPVTVDLAEQNASGESGTATLAEEGGQLTVTVELSGAPADPQPAHIHSGTCAELGDVVYPLTNVEGGTSETSVAATLADVQGAEHAINVHMSEADIGTYVACGDIPAG